MIIEEKMDINENVLCILKHIDEQSGHSIITDIIEIDYEPIIYPLHDIFEEFVEDAISRNVSAKEMLKNIKNSESLNALLEEWGYCDFLDMPYQGIDQLTSGYESDFSGILEADKNRLLGGEERDLTDEENNALDDQKMALRKKERNLLIEDLKHRLKAFNIFETYKLCNRKIEQQSMIDYSHREKGWNTPTCQITDNFTALINTNFGYGRSSYFYIVIKYKGILIVPYSDLIKYEFAEAYEIVGYSAKYYPSNESWKPAIEYARDACNFSYKDEKGFIEKYIVNECETMISAIENYLVGNRFTFNDNVKLYSGHNLIEFRGEKISSALSFIKSIFQFHDLLDISDYINRIESCNYKLQSILINDLIKIDRELTLLNNELDELSPHYNELNDIYRYYNKLKRHLSKRLKDDSNDNLYIITLDLSENISAEFRATIPAYKEFYSEYSELHSDYLELNEKISVLEGYKKNIHHYNSVIKDYFLSKEKEVNYNNR